MADPRALPTPTGRTYDESRAVSPADHSRLTAVTALNSHCDNDRDEKGPQR
ncbi:hypothetical protein [Streptomyces sp. NPDC023838]|uniref:hypothetical protein n=1 Tax=Streptomyces sp. NPDC023838 TaxID=3154325 RepID=UPI0033FE2DD6